MSYNTTWRKLITEEMDDHSDGWANLEGSTLTAEQADAEFHDGFGRAEGASFTVWTGRRVYFPAQYDGSEWCASVSRYPDGIATDHVGGG